MTTTKEYQSAAQALVDTALTQSGSGARACAEFVLSWHLDAARWDVQSIWSLDRERRNALRTVMDYLCEHAQATYLDGVTIQKINEKWSAK